MVFPVELNRADITDMIYDTLMKNVNNPEWKKHIEFPTWAVSYSEVTRWSGEICFVIGNKRFKVTVEEVQNDNTMGTDRESERR